jgi:hypothetical protein
MTLLARGPISATAPSSIRFCPAIIRIRHSPPLWFVTGDHADEIEVSIDADAGATAGLLLFFSRRLYAGLYAAGSARSDFASSSTAPCSRIRRRS